MRAFHDPVRARCRFLACAGAFRYTWFLAYVVISSERASRESAFDHPYRPAGHLRLGSHHLHSPALRQGHGHLRYDRQLRVLFANRYQHRREEPRPHHHHLRGRLLAVAYRAYDRVSVRHYRHPIKFLKLGLGKYVRFGYINHRCFSATTRRSGGTADTQA